jgi:chromosome segregation ATPase
MPKDLRDVLDNIESSEKQTAILQSKVDKLSSLVERQKRIISEQEAIVEEQKIKISKMSDIPEDILELKELIGAQRQQLNERELELEYTKGEVAQSQKELELVKKQIIPTQRKFEESYEIIGNLRAEMAEKSSELILKNEAVKNLNNKIEELQAFTDKFKEEQVKLISQLEDKRRIESQELKAELSKLENVLLEKKLQSTELDSDAKDAISRMESMKAKYEDLINRVGELGDKNREANDEIERLTRKIREIQEFQKENIDKIHHFDKLKPLMEKETLFKAFLIVEEVGAISLDDLRNALGSPIVLIKKMVQQLEEVGLLETNEQGKIVIKKIEEV